MGVVDPSIAAATFALAVTKSDVTTFDPPTRAIYVGTTGDVAVRMALGQNDVTFPAVAGSVILPIAVDRVLSTGTTASNIVRMW